MFTDKTNDNVCPILNPMPKNKTFLMAFVHPFSTSYVKRFKIRVKAEYALAKTVLFYLTKRTYFIAKTFGN